MEGLKINWFPGHMKKTLDTLEREVKVVDAVIYVLDSRAFLSCLNPKIDEIVKSKRVLYLLNKCDLISESDLKSMILYFKKQGKTAIAIQGTANNSQKIILSALKSLLKDKFDKANEKGTNPIFKVMVIGTPNTGKSTIINTLFGKKKAITGDKAGVTKANQWVRISDNFALLDTPGTLWPNMNDDEVKLKLAFIGGIKKDVVDQTELGFQLVRWLISNYPSMLTNRYAVSGFDREEIEVYNDILKKMGCIMRGGELDYDKGAVKVLEDFRSGRLGKICLDRV